MHPLFNLENFKKAIKDPIGAFLYLLGGRIFYSQTGEDVIIDWLTKKNNGFYVDIGGNHPIRLNNTYWFYKKGWRGINIEPNKDLIKKFNKIRSKDMNIQLGIGKQNGELLFNIFDCNAMSTCDSETVERYKNAGYKVVDTYSVPIWTLEKLFDTYVKDKEVDILSVDVEGWDMDVLESNNWDKYKPKYIILETVEYAKHGVGTWTKENDKFDLYLESKGYKVVAETGINTIYGLNESYNGK